MPWPKKKSYKEFDNEKKLLQLENSPPPPPITFLMVRPLERKESKINQESINEMLLIPEGTDKSGPLD